MTTKTMKADAEATMKLYRALEAAQAAAAERDVPVRNRTTGDKAAYMREAKRKSRDRQRAAQDVGEPMATADLIRDALADAALMILATDGPGAAQVRNVIDLAFPTRSGVSFTTASRARSRRLRPKLLTVDAIAAARAKVVVEAKQEQTAVDVADVRPRAKKEKVHHLTFRRPSFLR